MYAHEIQSPTRNQHCEALAMLIASAGAQHIWKMRREVRLEIRQRSAIRNGVRQSPCTNRAIEQVGADRIAELAQLH